MRALLPLLAAAALAAPAERHVAPERALVVLRAACSLGEPAFVRLDARTRPARSLNYRDTCGPEWGAAVARGTLAELARSGALLAVGWPGAAACDAVAAAARAMRVVSPPACTESVVRSSAVASLARALGWHRALLSPGAPGSACAATLERAATELRAAGLAVSRTPLPAAIAAAGKDSVVLLCADRALRAEPVATGVNAAAGPTALLVRVDEEPGAAIPENEEREWSGTGVVNLGRLHVAFRRVLLLAEERLGLEAPSVTESNVRDALAEALVYEAAAHRTGADSGETEFGLYERSNGTWARVGVLSVTYGRSLEPSSEWSMEVGRWNVSKNLFVWIDGDAAQAEENSVAGTPVGGALGACVALALLLAGALTAGALAARRCGRRRPRPRRAAVLARSDFAFPVDERSGPRVGEGMETMLSCWLQQLHEFGGPEPERPDLLKRPRAPSAPSSTCSVNRVVVDRRIRYKGDVVHLKRLPVTGTSELKRKATDVLLVMQNLRHENLNPFIGWLSEEGAGAGAEGALVWEACGRGSLEDVLRADDIALDWTFRLSLLTDLVRGMRYLHSSPLRVHGRLSSRNCAVDARWVLRITDYGQSAFYRAEGLPQTVRSARDLLWTAPELLRESRGEGPGSQPGDVFSFAIVMQEVIVRGEPYCMLALTPEEIVEKLSRPPPLIRPSVSMGAAPPEAVSVMRQCWSEAPDLRPDFHRLYDIFRHLHRGRKINIVDSMFEMLEKYSNNLEELIRERTEQLDMEKKKTEQLLNRMLPRSVAERLMLGSRVEPEEFEEVSIYFSDIVGFTELAARSTPVQVVDLLNDLYSTFDAAIERYRVYKVETIGDAYMVVGGLPARARDHAESVATMALHLLHLAGRFRVRHLRGAPLHLRIGLHSGPCCAGVVGLTMPRYCLFGDTVNTAARMESTGAAWRIQVSAATAALLEAAGGYRLRSRGLTQIKGKGAMHTYWLLGKDGFERPLPTPPPLESEDVLFEADPESDGEPCAAPPAPHTSPRTSSRTSPHVSPRVSPAPPSDKHAWQRSGAVSADSSPPRATPRVARAATTAPSDDHAALYARYRCLGSTRRPLRRQWSLERDDAQAAAAAGADPAPAARSAPPSPPLVLATAPARAAPSRYRTRPEPT